MNSQQFSFFITTSLCPDQTLSPPGRGLRGGTAVTKVMPFVLSCSCLQLFCHLEKIALSAVLVFLRKGALHLARTECSCHDPAAPPEVRIGGALSGRVLFPAAFHIFPALYRPRLVVALKRKIETEEGTFTRYALRFNETAVLFNDLSRYGKPQAGPVADRFGRIERLEDQRQDVPAHALPRVGYLHNDIMHVVKLFGPRGYLQGPARGMASIALVIRLVSACLTWSLSIRTGGRSFSIRTSTAIDMLL